MNWEAIGAIGQTVSALALVFVIVQVRHARDEMRRAAVIARLHGARDMYVTQATDERLTPLLMRALTAAGAPQPPSLQYFLDLGLNLEEAARLSVYFMAMWQSFVTSFETRKHLSPGVAREADNIAIGNYSTSPIGAKWFEMTKDRLNPDAVRYVENLLAQAK